MLPFRFVDRVKFIVERQLVKGAGFQLLVVGVFIGMISLIGGLLVIPSGEPHEDVGGAIWWAFLRLTDPGYLQLEDLVSEGGKRPQLIMELSDPDNRDLLAGHQSEMMISPIIFSHLLAQMALRRELRVVLDELFTVGGPGVKWRWVSGVVRPT